MVLEANPPPNGVDLNVPMSPQLKAAFANPTDFGDPTAYVAVFDTKK